MNYTLTFPRNFTTAELLVFKPNATHFKFESIFINPKHSIVEQAITQHTNSLFIT